MIKDYTAYLIFQTHGGRWKPLTDAQSELDEAKKEADKDKRREKRKKPEREIHKQCQELALHAPHSSFHYLEAVALGAKDQLRSAWTDLVVKGPDAAGLRIKDKWKLAELANIFESPVIPLTELPQLSFHLTFKFRLAKPFISRDEEALYVIDNPVRKDKVLGLPFIAPSSFKGLLRSAARDVLGKGATSDHDSAEIERLFGTDKRRETKDLNMGCLYCFPTFFRRVELAMMNPHSRETGAGSNPILFETATGEGTFNLLCLPVGIAGGRQSEVAEDLSIVAKTVRALFTDHGIGAKTSSGFGLAEPGVTAGKLSISAPGLSRSEEPSQPAAAAVPLAKHLKAPGVLKDEFLDGAGELLSEDGYKERLRKLGRNYNADRRRTYEKASKFWLKKDDNQQHAPEVPLKQKEEILSERSFKTFDELVFEADQMAAALIEEGGGGCRS